MADAHDVKNVIKSALDEIGMAGRVEVVMDGEKVAAPLQADGDEVEVEVVVQDAPVPDGQKLPNAE